MSPSTFISPSLVVILKQLMPVRARRSLVFTLHSWQKSFRRPFRCSFDKKTIRGRVRGGGASESPQVGNLFHQSHPLCPVTRQSQQIKEKGGHLYSGSTPALSRSETAKLVRPGRSVLEPPRKSQIAQDDANAGQGASSLIITASPPRSRAASFLVVAIGRSPDPTASV